MIFVKKLIFLAFLLGNLEPLMSMKVSTMKRKRMRKKRKKRKRSSTRSKILMEL
jgi:hypothetical protein